MTHNNIDTKTQADIQIKGNIDDFFNKFSIATSLHRCGVRKRHGYSVRPPLDFSLLPSADAEKLGSYCEKTATAFFDAVMGTTFQKFSLVTSKIR